MVLDYMTKGVILGAGWAIWILSLFVVAYDYWSAIGQSGAFFALVGGFAVLLAMVAVPVIADARLGPNA